MRYEAFVSYRHGGIDEKVAVRVHKEIEKYRIPGKLAKKLGRKHVGRVFRDSDELQASSDLSAVIREAIEDSEWLIVILTERYLESPWCQEELEHFIRLRGRERVIVLLVSGEPKDVFPKVLTEIERDGEIVQIEPLAVDIRAESEHAVLKNLGQERFRFFSSMLGVNYDDLRNRQRERRRRRMAAVLASVFAVLAVVIGVITVKNIQLNEAYDALDQSNQETLRGESYYLAEYADEAYLNGDRQTAMKLALMALPKDFSNPDRPYVADAVRSLTQATGIYDYTAGYQAAFVVEREEETYETRTQISKDGSLVLIENYEEVVDSLRREVRVVRVSDGAEICRYTGASIHRNVYLADTMGAALSEDGKRLYYLSEKGLTCVEVESGHEIFTVEKAVDMRVDWTAAAGSTAILTVDYLEGKLYGYDTDGNQTLDVEIGNDVNYELGQIDPAGRCVALSVNSEAAYGIVTINVDTGAEATYMMEGPCQKVRFSGEGRLCFLMSDLQDGLRHIVQYETKSGEQRYLCNTALDVPEMELTDRATCYYYVNNTIYEVDCNSEKGKTLWEYTFPSGITGVRVGDGLVAVSFQNGSVSVFEEDGKREIRTPDGSGDAVFVESIAEQVLTTRDYWGRSLRVYVRKGAQDHKDAKQTSLAELTGGDAPNQWFGVMTNCDRFLLGLDLEDGNHLVEYDSGTLEKLCSKSISEMGLTGKNESFSMISRDFITVLDYEYYEHVTYAAADMKEVYRTSMENRSFSDQQSPNLYETKDGKIHVIDQTNGKVIKKVEIPDGFDGGFYMGDRIVYSGENKVRIDGSDGKTEMTLDAVKLESYNEKRQLLFYRNMSEDTWYAYDVSKKQVVCEDKSKNNKSIQFFGENRYILVDYSEVYDMDTWQKVLELKAEDGNIYGVQTTDTLPYLVVWCRRYAENRSSLDMAVLYEKGGTGEPVGEVPNFVTLSEDGEVITYDGEQTLYKFPLLSVAQIKERAEKLVGNPDFTERQKKRYHLFG